MTTSWICSQILSSSRVRHWAISWETLFEILCPLLTLGRSTCWVPTPSYYLGEAQRRGCESRGHIQLKESGLPHLPLPVLAEITADILIAYQAAVHPHCPPQAGTATLRGVI